MAGFNFRRREDIDKVFEVIKGSPYVPLTPDGEFVKRSEAITEGWLFLTPVGGIPARSGFVCGKADCTPYHIDEDDNLVELLDDDGSSQTVEVHHIGTDAVDGFSFIQVKEVFGVLVAETLGGGTAFGTGSTIIFEIVTESGAAEASSNDCDAKLGDGASSYMAHVRWRPCGVSRVPEETDEGLVEVFDPLGSFLANRENSEIQGRTGVATYMVEQGGYDCQWVITWIDWFREIQIIHDIIHTEEEIRFKVKKIKTWDDCDLPDIVIPLIDCQDES